MGNIIDKIVTQEDNLNEPMTKETRRGRKLPGLSLRCYHIGWTYWVLNEWAFAVAIVVPTFEALWGRMDLNNPWGPSFPACNNYDTADGTSAADIAAQD